MVKNVFDATATAELIARLQKLNKVSQPTWGKMSVAQMLAHCNVTYEMVYEDKHPKPNVIMKFMMKLIVKEVVTNEKIYKKNSRTAPQFLIVDEREFETEKNRLEGYIRKTAELGASYFEGKESHSFGALTTTQWNNMFYKHLDHHFTQFGV